MHSRRRRRRRRRALIALAIVVVILAGGAGASAFAYTTIKTQAGQLQAQLTAHLQAGQSELEAAKSSLVQANSAHDLKLITDAKAHFAAAKEQFLAASQGADHSELLSRLEKLPAVGDLALSRHVAVDGIAEMGVALTDAGQELADLDAKLIKPPVGGQGAGTLLTVLDETQSSLIKVRADVDRAQTAASRVDIRVLPAPQQATFARARGTIATAIAGIVEFDRLIPIITEMLGGNGARTYLVEQVNPSELRAGGGFIGTYSLLRADHGALRLIESGDAASLSEPRAALGEAGYVAPPGPLREFLPNTSWSFIDSNFFPDFASNAKAAESFAQAKLGSSIDGVISIDYYTVAKMLELTGPLAVPGYNLTVDATNFVPQVVHYDLNDDPIHKAIVAAVAGPLMQRVSTLPPDRWPALIGALNDVATARHLQVYFNNDGVEKEIDRFGWSGALIQTGAKDFIMEVESNLGGTKANWFIARHYTVLLTRNGAILHHNITVDLIDNMPYDFRPREYYRAYIRLYVGGNASSDATSLRGVVYPNPAPPVGTRMLDGWLPLFHGYGHTAQAVFEYDTPWQGNGRSVEQIYWQKQPGTESDTVDIVWKDGNGHTYKVTGDLSQDRIITVAPTGVSLLPGHSAAAKLPGLSLG